MFGISTENTNRPAVYLNRAFRVPKVIASSLCSVGINCKKLSVRVGVSGITWTRKSADAEVGIKLSGAIANVPSDTDIPVNI
ncbi:hypothetical protein CSA37_09200 [Candidatus Fermentibacteria bacterium]|nr:MAG: hypothetical protein CSA37_09200 [Candidatus Fermentibacteria bacterium]